MNTPESINRHTSPGQTDPSAKPTDTSEQSQSVLEKALRFNLNRATRIAKDIADNGFTIGFDTLDLIQPDDSLDQVLRGDCDESNRQMLDTLYKLAHSDPEDVRLADRPSDSWVARERVIPTPSGFTFIETLTRRDSGPGEFTVKVYRSDQIQEILGLEH